MKFKKLGLMPELCKAVESRGYEEPTPIQAGTIPAILDRRDVLAGAQTGTGKTAAFALPMLQLLEHPTNAGPRALIITPTRELADQVAESFIAYGKNLNLRVAKIYGGVNIKPQIRSQQKGVDIVVATPGRLMDHVRQKTIDLSNIDMFVLDEADRMLDMGFINDIKSILRELTKSPRQTLMFSATYDKDVEKLALNLLQDPVRVDVAKRNAAASDVRQVAHFVEKQRQFELLLHLIQTGNWYQVLIFVRTKHGADRLAKKLHKAGVPSAAIHGDKKQGARTRALANFKKGDLQALIATDIAARGIDLTDLSHVVNYDLPQQPEDYIHRIGRTGRAGKSGDAITLVGPEEKAKLSKIEQILKSKIPVKVIEGFEPPEQSSRMHRSEPSSRGSAGQRSGQRNTRGSGHSGSSGDAENTRPNKRNSSRGNRKQSNPSRRNSSGNRG